MLCQFVAWGHTSTAQVANMLTSEVGSGGLNDGIPTPKDEEDERLAGKKVMDSSGPAVWFVAQGGQIPPQFKVDSRSIPSIRAC